MAELKTLSVSKREKTGKGHNRRLRAQQQVPCVFYSPKGETLSVQASAKDLSKLYEEVGRTTVFNLVYNDDDARVVSPALFWDVQMHPVKRAFTHIDFYGVDLDREVKLIVPLEFVGVAKGTKLGGKLETYREQVALRGKPLDIPARVQVDVTDLDLNNTMHVADLRLPPGVSAATNPEYALVAVVSRDAEAGEEPAA